MFQRLAGEGRRVVLLELVLDVEAVVRVAVGCDNRVIREFALERQVLQLFCVKAASAHVAYTENQYQMQNSIRGARLRNTKLGDQAKRCGRHWRSS